MSLANTFRKDYNAVNLTLFTTLTGLKELDNELFTQLKTGSVSKTVEWCLTKINKDKPVQEANAILDNLKALAGIKIKVSDSTQVQESNDVKKTEANTKFNDELKNILIKTTIKHKAFHVYLLLRPIIDLHKIQTEVAELKTKATVSENACSKQIEEIKKLTDNLEKYRQYAMDSIPLHDSLSQITNTGIEEILKQ